MSEEKDGFDIKMADVEPGDLPLWYQQFIKFDDKKKSEAIEKTISMIKAKNPELYSFIRQYRCVLVGVMPMVQYNLPDCKHGDGDTTWIHGFAVPTLIYWHPKGKFSFFANPILRFDETVLNEVGGNPRQNIKGFTG